MTVCCGKVDLVLFSPPNYNNLGSVGRHSWKSKSNASPNLPSCLQPDSIVANTMETVDARVDNSQQSNCASSQKHEGNDQFFGGNSTTNLPLETTENRKRPPSSHVEVRMPTAESVCSTEIPIPLAITQFTNTNIQNALDCKGVCQ